MGLYAGAQWIGRHDIPLTDDAEFYLGAAQVYKAWFGEAWGSLRQGNMEALRQETVDRHFAYNWVHPPVAKLVMAAGIAVLHDGLGWLDVIEAGRAGIVLLSILLAALMFLLCWPVYGPWVAASAPLLLLLMPRFFFHSHVESLDVASAATYFLAVFCFWRARGSVAWSAATAVAYAVAMATKINGALVVVPLGLWTVATWRRTRD
ncbi:MAG TPA: glycosyltransferase family 39 protein, partial [Vicinamibacteria bacterium]|nr:glycosyltransferase family 39 protein [Vicinamibacteria bacterium]